MVADFNAVVDLTNTLGGVQVCVNAPIVDPLSTLNLPKGNSLIQGEQALAFLRTRHGFGDGSDLGRIKAQQGFLASMVRKIKSDGTLTDIPKLYSIADTVTKNLTVDNDLASIPALLDMANRLKSIDPQNVTFVTAPNEPYVLDPNRVQLQEQTAQLLFRAVAADEDVTKALSPAAPVAPAAGTAEAAPSAAGSPAATATPTPTAAALPADVTGQSGADATCQSAYTG
jgi:anionic cell wall polymer biosynthesis LytR-Cps2A-Psr (LCP) family protein